MQFSINKGWKRVLGLAPIQLNFDDVLEVRDKDGTILAKLSICRSVHISADRCIAFEDLSGIVLNVWQYSKSVTIEAEFSDLLSTIYVQISGKRCQEIELYMDDYSLQTDGDSV